MKRPFAVIGFSMLLTSLIVMNIKFKTTVALLFGVTVALLIFLGFKNLRKQKFIILTLVVVVIFIIVLGAVEETLVEEDEERM